MKWTPRLWWTSLIFSFFAFFCAAEELVDSATGIKFPGTVSFDHQAKSYTLSGTGVATRKKFFVKVYSVASYIEDLSHLGAGDKGTNLVNAKGAKQLTLTFVREVPAAKLTEGYRESFHKVPYNNQENINKFLGFFENAKAKDTHIFRWLPDGTVMVLINNQEKGRIQNQEFARALWNIWFGNTGVVDKKQLTQKLK